MGGCRACSMLAPSVVDVPSKLRARGWRRIGRTAQLAEKAYLSFDQAEPGCLSARLASRVHVELAQDRRDVVPDSLLRQEEPFGDLGVAETLGHQRQDVELARGEVGWVLAGSQPRAAR